MTNTTLDHTSRFRQTAREAGYLLAAWPILLTGFVVVTTLLATGAGLVLLWVGLPMMVGALLLARQLATAQRNVTPALRGGDVVRAHYQTGTGTGIARFLGPLRDQQSWLDVVWVAAAFLVSTFTWSVALVWVVTAIAGLLGPVAMVILHLVLGDQRSGLGDLLGLPFALGFDIVTSVALGLAALLTAPRVMRGLTNVQLGLAEALLASPARHRARISELTESRRFQQQAETDSLQRLERDIHDGPQQRLVRLQMDLARARQQMDKDPVRARSILSDAMVLTGDTLDELRNLSRGIAPPVLVDRGLEAAVTQLAGTSDVPVVLFANVPGRLPGHVESTAYFVVSEALANVNKHSQATEAVVTIGISDDALYVSVKDDGLGGAAMSKGHGLQGLLQRVRGAGGDLSVNSPAGGGTQVEAMIPCAS